VFDKLRNLSSLEKRGSSPRVSKGVVPKPYGDPRLIDDALPHGRATAPEINAATGFSWELSISISGVARSSRVRQVKIVETTNVIVQASPPSMP